MTCSDETSQTTPSEMVECVICLGQEQVAKTGLIMECHRGVAWGRWSLQHSTGNVLTWAWSDLLVSEAGNSLDSVSS